MVEKEISMSQLSNFVFKIKRFSKGNQHFAIGVAISFQRGMEKRK